tara:strand:- start:1626 stop:1907 length:282 start_codon:yes stop_codon:yes gene_type:complete
MNYYIVTIDMTDGVVEKHTTILVAGLDEDEASSKALDLECHSEPDRVTIDNSSFRQTYIDKDVGFRYSIGDINKISQFEYKLFKKYIPDLTDE